VDANRQLITLAEQSIFACVAVKHYFEDRSGATSFCRQRCKQLLQLIFSVIFLYDRWFTLTLCNSYHRRTFICWEIERRTRG